MNGQLALPKPYRQEFLDYLVRLGCKNFVPVKGNSVSELCLHTKQAYLDGEFAMFYSKNSGTDYGWIYFENGTMVNGIVHVFKDGTFSVA